MKICSFRFPFTHFSSSDKMYFTNLMTLDRAQHIHINAINVFNWSMCLIKNNNIRKVK